MGKAIEVHHVGRRAYVTTPVYRFEIFLCGLTSKCRMSISGKIRHALSGSVGIVIVIGRFCVGNTRKDACRKLRIPFKAFIDNRFGNLCSVETIIVRWYDGKKFFETMEPLLLDPLRMLRILSQRRNIVEDNALIGIEREKQRCGHFTNTQCFVVKIDLTVRGTHSLSTNVLANDMITSYP